MITEDELKELQSSIAWVDAMPDYENALGLIQFLVAELSDIHIQIRMEPDNHKEPHVHIKCGKINHCASFSIRSGKLLVGKSSKYDETIENWILEHQKGLMLLWEKVKAGDDYKQTLLALKK